MLHHVPSSTPPADSFVIDRAMGALLGAAIGDAVGTTLEDLPADPLRLHPEATDDSPFSLRPKRWTRHTAMSLALADALLDPDEFTPVGFMNRLVQWFDTGEFACQGTCIEIGRSTRIAIRRFMTTGALSYSPDTTAGAGNGSLVRLAPVALRYLHDARQAECVVRQQSYCTHAAPEAADAAAYFVTLLRQLILAVPNATLPRRLDVTTSPRLAAVAAGSFLRLPRPRPTGQVSDTLEVALRAFHHTEDFQQAVIVATSLGGASSSIGAVSGMLAGAAYGLSAMPRRWLQRLVWRHRILAIGYELLGAAPCRADA